MHDAVVSADGKTNSVPRVDLHVFNVAFISPDASGPAYQFRAAHSTESSRFQKKADSKIRYKFH